MEKIPTQTENPNGLHQRFLIKKIVGIEKGKLDYSDRNGGNRRPDKIITKDVDPKAEYFVLRMDKNGSDPVHIEACRKAVLVYAEEIKNHLPQLSEDLILRYNK